MATRTRTPIRPETGRLPRVTPTGRADRGREIRIGVLGVLGILLLVVGIPTALAVFVGYPLPRTAPSADWLTQSITATLIIKILACVLWIVWAHFTACVIAEWRALRAGRMPSDLPFGGGSQALARRLVAAALLLSGVATTAHSFVGTGSAPMRASAPPAAVSSVTGASVPGVAGAAEAAVAEAGAREQAAASAATKYYVVQPPHGRRYDCLWDIAERTLGDPRRYHEIFQLNKDRLQADGRRLVDANLILPGWELRLPSDATGAGVRHAPAAAPSTTVRTTVPATTSTPALSPAFAAAAQPAQQHAGATTRLDDQLPELAIGGGLMLAGVLVALSARRGPYAAADDDLATLADPGLASRLDRQLRALAEARTAQGRQLPAPVVARVDDDGVQLVLAGGDVTEPPEPWRAGTHSDWLLEPAVDAQPELATAAPFPALLAVGRQDDDGPEVFVDLEQAPGIVTVAGAPGRAREFAAALAVHAATCAWSDGARVTMIGFAGGEELVPFAPESIRYVDRVTDALPEAEERATAAARLRQQLGVGSVLSGRLRRRDPAWRPHLLVLSGPPALEDAARLERLVAGRSNVVALVVGEVSGAPWRFVMDEAGRLDLGALGATVVAHRLTDVSRRRLADEITAAARQRTTRTGEVAALTPAAAAAEVTAANPVRSDVPAVAEVSLLGPVTVSAAGEIPEEQRELATEIVVAVALHPDGVHEAALRASIWPRGVGDEVFATAMRTAAAWLGSGSDGAALLAPSDDGRWRVGAGVRVDWNELRAIAASAAGDRELSRLTAALDLVQGEAFSATPPGRYRWLPFARSARDARVVGTAIARRAAELLVASDRPIEAVAALRAGLRLVPTSELLWRQLLTLTSGDGPGGAAAVAAEMYETLRAHRVWPEGETDALAAQVAPGVAAS